MSREEWAKKDESPRPGVVRLGCSLEVGRGHSSVVRYCRQPALFDRMIDESQRLAGDTLQHEEGSRSTQEWITSGTGMQGTFFCTNCIISPGLQIAQSICFNAPDRC